MHQTIEDMSMLYAPVERHVLFGRCGYGPTACAFLNPSATPRDIDPQLLNFANDLPQLSCSPFNLHYLPTV